MEMRRLLMINLTISFSSLIMMIFFSAASAILILNAGGAGGNYNQPEDDHDVLCGEQKCSPHGPAVRFPFRLIGKQPESCGYSYNNNNNNDYDSSAGGYNLRCDVFNRTILELPSSSIKVVVTNISYFSQSLEVQSLEPCFAKQLKDLDISTTPFQYIVSYYDDDYYYSFHGAHQYSLFNCTSRTSSSGRSRSTSCINITCLQSHGFEVYATPTNYPLEYLAGELESCTKIYDTNLISPEILFTDSMHLRWSLPQCGRSRCKGTLKNLCISGPIMGLFLMLSIAICISCSTKKVDRENQIRFSKFLEDYAAMKPTRYSYADIKKITNNFKRKLGEGGYGNVYKGQVSNEIFVAVKLLHDSTGNGEEFINEVGTMGTIHHVNVVRLLGFCADGYKRALVYEFLPNGSLDKFIFPDGQVHHTLRMGRLQDIAVGIARGIEYLHQGCEHRILHFDIKPHNILLDDKYNPKISDFGLAKLCEKGRSAVSMTAARGTMGYIAPEVFSRQFGNVSYKSDVYSFGMLLLEMVGRRKNIDATVQNVSQVYFPEWVYGRLVNGEELRIQVEDDEENQIAKRLAIVGLWCIQWNPVDRPSITSVLQMLEGSSSTAENLISLPQNPFTSSAMALNPADPSDHRRPFSSALAMISESE